ncbi:hypothetical protein F5Y10DRAFT_248564 [Nemania abortiva]|nr:hypothetical protein F5Y10DRAFT_248564 [Nemania abortiva]
MREIRVFVFLSIVLFSIVVAMWDNRPFLVIACRMVLGRGLFMISTLLSSIRLLFSTPLEVLTMLPALTRTK